MTRGMAASLIAALSAAVVSSAIVPPPPILIWNASESAPLGLYRVAPVTNPAVDELVAARLPSAVRALADRRGYLPSSVPLIKRVAATEFSRVCASGPDITIDGVWVSARWRRDGRGRALPWWEGCVLLREGKVFLLADNRPDAFDGRYFGVSDARDIFGKAVPLWLR